MSTPLRILVTTFQPFRGRERNGSQTIGRALASQYGSDRLHVLELPVTWGSVESVALPTIANLQPDILLGLGEGTPDFLKIETIARNKRVGVDEAQSPPSTEVIDTTGPTQGCCRWPLPQPLPNFDDVALKLSEDAGCYLCNNALYRYSLCESSFAGFFHLPPQGVDSDQAYRDRWYPIVSQLLDFAIQQLPDTRATSH